jgi:hypothetical protein
VNHVFVPGLIAGWATLVAGCWLNWQLLRQNGRMLLRLEALEKRIKKFESGREDESERLLLDSPETDLGLRDQGRNDYAPVEQSKLDSMRRAKSPLRRHARTRNRPCSSSNGRVPKE